MHEKKKKKNQPIRPLCNTKRMTKSKMDAGYSYTARRSLKLPTNDAAAAAAAAVTPSLVSFFRPSRSRGGGK